ncbi:16S rRNA (cytidine(1402)-2'-O)-methyltransferase [Paracoccus sanguinis]|uniref:16S rRNA (cytidine(1402)-2'-O)-methyltransferase n=1 Tax=Paracoccus sanguinis TaxID=1545044 RepID=UPI00145142A7|nr:16S rRNA (cytidine(1402)-2'-O)-methyltransferase [Paracoccus sanguinis]QJD17583.1 16S rRNA (cytidine(1402)-2'-O)-methyltransferase [Paracoccus sanguinis]
MAGSDDDGSGGAVHAAPQPVPAGVLAARLEPGLHLVATPIGTARDITLRALDVLNAADLLAAEDTRTLRHLLAIHGIPLRGRRIVAHHDHNAARSTPGILAAIGRGEAVAYASDAGTPLVADPGFTLAREVTAAGGRVHAVPGASALLAALSVAGQPTDRFLFAGFAPSAHGARRRWLAEVAGVGTTAVIFESPRRVKEMLEELCELDPNRAISVCRELTKKFEEVRQGTVAEVAAGIPVEGLRGEVVVVLGPRPAEPADDDGVRAALAGRLAMMSVRDAAAAVAAETGRARKDVYRMALAMQEGE